MISHFINTSKIRSNRGFSLVELLLLMALVTILIAIALPSVRGMQNEARKAKIEGDLRTIKVAIESYYKNHANEYPPLSDYQNILLAASPRVLDTVLYDPFGTTTTTPYVYLLSNDEPTSSHYYIIFSVGADGSGIADVDNSGYVTASGEAIWESNGHI